MLQLFLHKTSGGIIATPAVARTAVPAIIIREFAAAEIILGF
jgi:hypothetical protein